MSILKLLRLEYLFSVLFPCFVALLINGLELIPNYLAMIFGWAFLGIAGNVINDIIDKDRDLPYTNKEMASVAICSFMLGLTLMLRYLIFNPINLTLFILAIALVLAYCLWLKKLPILNKFALVFSHLIIPYLIIKIPLFWEPGFILEIFILFGMFFLGVSGQVVHEVIDDESSSKFSRKSIQITVLVTAGLSVVCFILFLIFSIVLMIFFWSYLFIPFLIPPIGAAYMFRAENKPRKTTKTVGVVIGNLLLVYVVIMLFL